VILVMFTVSKGNSSEDVYIVNFSLLRNQQDANYILRKFVVFIYSRGNLIISFAYYFIKIVKSTCIISDCSTIDIVVLNDDSL
jgi:hypothetical protein